MRLSISFLNFCNFYTAFNSVTKQANLLFKGLVSNVDYYKKYIIYKRFDNIYQHIFIRAFYTQIPFTVEFILIISSILRSKVTLPDLTQDNL